MTVIRAAGWGSFWTTAALVVGACSLVPWITPLLADDDVEAIESPLALLAARQLVHSPRELYGPYFRGNHLVLIHAPLYYRATALLAWPLTRAGIDPVPAVLAAGRGLSLAGLLATLAAAFWMVRLGGSTRRVSRHAPTATPREQTGNDSSARAGAAQPSQDPMPRLAGWWAVLLVAATPIHGGLPFAVRPDMAGVALQTVGVLLILNERTAERPRARMLLSAFVCFALAVCIKQHFVAVPLVSAGLLLAEWRRGRLPVRTIGAVLLAGLAVVAAYYGIEEWATRGLLSRSVFVTAASVGRMHPAGWLGAVNIVLGVVWKCVGLILLLAAAGLLAVPTSGGAWNKTLAGAGAALVSATALFAVLQFFVLRMWVSVSIVVALVVILAGVIPACRIKLVPAAGRGVEPALWKYLAAELVVVAILCKLSTGAWYNYAIQAVVFAAVITARALARGFALAPAKGPIVAAVLAAASAAAFAWTDVEQMRARRRAEHSSLGYLLRGLNRPNRELFFVDRPGDNRVHGQSELVYDPWLYPVFEAAGRAEPRQEWLYRELAHGAVRVVVATSPRTGIDGITQSLPELGFRAVGRFGPYFVWIRPN